MIAVITYKFLGEEVRLHCTNMGQYEAALYDVQELRKMVPNMSVHVYECVDITAQAL